MKNSEFTSHGARWLKMRLKPENYYTAFYKSGKFLITGVKSNDKLNEIVQWMTQEHPTNQNNFQG